MTVQFGEWTDILIIAGLIFLFTLMRIALSNYSFWFDEYASLFFADQPLSRLWSTWIVRETNPPLFYTLLKCWHAVVGDTVLWLRLLPELGGALQLALFAGLGQALFGRRGAYYAVLIVGCSAQTVAFHQMLRGYVFAADALALSLLGLLLWHQSGERRPGFLLLYASAAAAGIYCHTTLIFWPVVATPAYLIANIRHLPRARWQIVRQLVLANSAIIAMAGWWIFITVQQVGQAGDRIGWIPVLGPMQALLMILQTALLLFVRGSAVDLVMYLILSIALFIALGILLRKSETRLVGLAALIGPIVFFVVSWIQPIITMQTSYIFTTFTVLAFTGLIVALPRTTLQVATASMLCLLLLGNLALHRHDLRLEDWDGALRTVSSRPHAALLVSGETMAVVTGQACAQALNARPCPFRLIALATPFPDSIWARGSSPAGLVTRHDLATRLSGVETVYTLRSSELDPLVQLGLVDGTQRHAWNVPFLEGPFSVSHITAGQP